MHIKYLILVLVLLAAALGVVVTVYAKEVSGAMSTSVNTDDGVQMQQQVETEGVDQQLGIETGAPGKDNKTEGNETHAMTQHRRRRRAATVTKTDGSIVVEILNRGRFKLNKTITITNETKEIHITTPRSEITITKEIDDNESRRAIVEIEKFFSNTDEVKRFILDPVRARIEAEVEKEGEMNRTMIPRRLRARFRARIKNRVINLTLNESTKRIQIISGNVTVETNKEVEIENGTVYVKITKHIKKRINVLPEEASEVAKRKVNYHAVKTIRIETEGENAVYKVIGSRRGRLLGLFNIDMEVQTDVDVDSGIVRNVRRPWWSFLVF
jgi:hypothetical protein